MGIIKTDYTVKELENLIEKDKPKKPIIDGWIYCPNCNHKFGLWRSETFCRDCGQKIDWSEEE